MLRDPRRRQAYDRRLENGARVRMQLAEAQAEAGRQSTQERGGRTPQGPPVLQARAGRHREGQPGRRSAHLQTALTFEPDNALVQEQLAAVRKPRAEAQPGRCAELARGSDTPGLDARRSACAPRCALTRAASAQPKRIPPWRKPPRRKRPLPVVEFLKIPETGRRPISRASAAGQCSAIFLGERADLLDVRRARLARARSGSRTRASSTSTRSCYRSFPGIEMPYISAVVDLEGGGTVKGNLIDIDPDPAEDQDGDAGRGDLQDRADARTAKATSTSPTTSSRAPEPSQLSEGVRDEQTSTSLGIDMIKFGRFPDEVGTRAGRRGGAARARRRRPEDPGHARRSTAAT